MVLKDISYDDFIILVDKGKNFEFVEIDFLLAYNKDNSVVCLFRAHTNKKWRIYLMRQFKRIIVKFNMYF